MRRETAIRRFKSLLLALVAGYGSFHDRLCMAQQTSSGPSKSAYTYVGAHQGLFFYSSPSLEAINKRLGNSVALAHSAEFGRARAYGLDLARATHDTWFLASTVNYFGETLNGRSQTSAEISSRASLSFFQWTASLGLRFYPWPGGFGTLKPHWLGLIGRGNGGSAPSRRKIERFYSILYLTGGGTFMSHAFSMRDTTAGTDITYAFNTLHALYGPTLRVAYRFGTLFDFYLDTTYLTSRSLWVKTHVASYVLKEEQLGTKKENLNLDGLAKTPLKFLQPRLGATFFF